jgi:hypothetical protein
MQSSYPTTRSIAKKEKEIINKENNNNFHQDSITNLTTTITNTNPSREVEIFESGEPIIKSVSKFEANEDDSIFISIKHENSGDNISNLKKEDIIVELTLKNKEDSRNVILIKNGHEGGLFALNQYLLFIVPNILMTPNLNLPLEVYAKFLFKHSLIPIKIDESVRSMSIKNDINKEKEEEERKKLPENTILLKFNSVKIDELNKKNEREREEIKNSSNFDLISNNFYCTEKENLIIDEITRRDTLKSMAKK